MHAACDSASEVPSPRVGIVTSPSQIDRTAPDNPRFSPPIARSAPAVKSTS